VSKALGHKTGGECDLFQKYGLAASIVT